MEQQLEDLRLERLDSIDSKARSRNAKESSRGSPTNDKMRGNSVNLRIKLDELRGQRSSLRKDLQELRAKAGEYASYAEKSSQS